MVFNSIQLSLFNDFTFYPNKTSYYCFDYLKNIHFGSVEFLKIIS